MSIRLNRKKLLCISFFLCCVLPACFTWFENDSLSWRGLSMLELPLLISTMLFAFALMFERPQYMLPLGILSHLVLLAFLLNCFISFPVVTGISDARDLSLSLDSVRPLYWLSLILLPVHLTLFTTTEIAVQKLTRQSDSSTKRTDC